MPDSPDPVPPRSATPEVKAMLTLRLYADDQLIAEHVDPRLWADVLGDILAAGASDAK